jgi:proteasome lid subunit RPN8/RPN11
MSDLESFMKSILRMAPMEEKKEVFKFAARCRDQDRQYEINNNAELDNGVYHKFVYSSKMTPANKELEGIMRAESIYFQEIVQDKNRTMAV